MTSTPSWYDRDQPIAGQRFALVSLVGPAFAQKADRLGFAVRGVVDSEADAKALAERIQQTSPINSVDIHLVDVGAFVPIDQGMNALRDVSYTDEEVANFIGSIRKERELAKSKFEEYKRTKMAGLTTMEEIEDMSQGIDAEIEEALASKRKLNELMERMKKEGVTAVQITDEQPTSNV